MKALKMQKVEEAAEADSKLNDAIAGSSRMTSRIEDLEEDIPITRANNLEHQVELYHSLKTQLENQASMERYMDDYQHLTRSARGKIQSLCKCIEEEATRSDALHKELDAQRP